jgi:hypothetical protein
MVHPDRGGWSDFADRPGRDGRRFYFLWFGDQWRRERLLLGGHLPLRFDVPSGGRCSGRFEARQAGPLLVDGSRGLGLQRHGT